MNKRTITVVSTLLIAIALPLTVFVAMQTQNIRKKASELNTITTLPIPVPVLVLSYYPRDSNNAQLLDGNETGLRQDAQVNGRTVAFWEEKTEQMISSGLSLINESTKYHGYKDPSAPQFLNYSVLEHKKFYEALPRGHLLERKPGGDAHRPNYGKILGDLNICDYVDRSGVKEVWMYGYHNDNGIVPDESKMSSRYGDISNAQPKDEQLDPQFRLPLCTNSYVLYNFTYNPDGNPGNNLHNRLHQIENVIPYAEGTWPPTSENTRGSVFWDDFAEYVQDNSYFVEQNGSRKPGYRSSCGNGHITPNWGNTRSEGYRYDLTIQGEFNCETWHPDDARTTYIRARCERWGCSDTGFYKWFMQNIPGYNSGIEYQGRKMRNWWEAMYDFNAFIAKDRSIYGESIFPGLSQPTTVPTPTNTPTPTPTIPAQNTPTPEVTPIISPAATPTVSLTPTGSLLPLSQRGDTNDDGVIDIFDYSLVVAHFGPRMPTGGSPADFDRDGDVDIFDYNIILENFGRTAQ